MVTRSMGESEGVAINSETKEADVTTAPRSCTGLGIRIVLLVESETARSAVIRRFGAHRRTDVGWSLLVVRPRIWRT